MQVSTSKRLKGLQIPSSLSRSTSSISRRTEVLTRGTIRLLISSLRTRRRALVQGRVSLQGP